MSDYLSIATWAKGLVHNPFEDDDTTVDRHDTKEQAEAVCRMLERDGLGGERCHFPIATRVEPAPPTP